MKEIDELEAAGVDVRGRLRISEACPLILPYHVALDAARERAKGEAKIGTTGRGIGPAYEDKVARRAIRVQDLYARERFAAKLGEVLDYHNFVLKNYFKADDGRLPEDARRHAGARREAEAHGGRRLRRDQRADHARARRSCSRARRRRCSTSTTAPTRSSPRPTASRGRRRAGAGVGPQQLHYILGITKAYTTRVGGGPFPTELDDEIGEHLRERGNEFGSVTGRPRRCGWFDAAALKRAIQINGLSGCASPSSTCWTAWTTVRVAVGYKVRRRDARHPAGRRRGAGHLRADLRGSPGLEGKHGRRQDARRAAANARRLPEAPGGPVPGCRSMLISTGPDREETIVLRHPFA